MWFPNIKSRKIILKIDNDYDVYRVYPCQTGIGCVYVRGHCIVLFSDGSIRGPFWCGNSWCPHSGWTSLDEITLDIQKITSNWKNNGEQS